MSSPSSSNSDEDHADKPEASSARQVLATPLPSTPSPRASISETHVGFAAENKTLLGAANLDWILDNDSGRYFLRSEFDLSQHGEQLEVSHWRLTERLRTVGIGIGLCLNLGTDPPDSDRVSPCARTECGVDPTAYGDTPSFTVLKLIGHNLEEQFRSWQPKARIKLVADPTVEMIRKMCVSLRKHSKQERIMIHINGHGVPKPTSNGEIWVYNEDFTQYIPLACWDLCRWAGFPALFSFDCSGAGNLLRHFLEQDRENEKRYKAQMDDYLRQEAKWAKERERRVQREKETELLRRQAGHAPLPPSPALAAESVPPGEGLQKPVRKRYMCLLPCDADEVLPSSPDLPADLFTCCLTTPIPIALRWFILQNQVTMEPLGIEPGMATLVPGKAGDRRSMLGELNWVFTAVTDAIAWSVLSREQFQALFRHDPLVASMLRNFLLAERIFKSLGCTPSSLPVLPSTWRHPMWDAWDQAVEHALMQLPFVLSPETLSAAGCHKAARLARLEGGYSRGSGKAGGSPAEHVESSFFKDQLQAFETWLSHPSPPRLIDQLPVILQVLLTRQHRFLALDQLARFLDMGQWAVVQALGVGIFPYMLKLLQTPVPNLKRALVRIWARIIAHDPTVRNDLGAAKAFTYFSRQLDVNDSEHSVRALVVLAYACHKDPQCQGRFFAADIDQACLALLPDAGLVASETETDDETSSKTSESDHAPLNGSGLGADASPRLDGSGGGGGGAPSSPPRRNGAAPRSVLLGKWACMVLANLWDGHEASRLRAISLDGPRRVAELLHHPDAEVREAAVHTLGCLLGPTQDKVKSPEVSNFECDLCLRLLKARNDGSGAVRREIVFAVARFIADSSTHYGPILLTVQALSEYRQRKEDGYEASKETLLRVVGPRGYKYLSIWLDVSRVLSADPFPAVSQAAQVLSRVVKHAVEARIDAIRVRVSGVAVAPPVSSGVGSSSGEDDEIDLVSLGLQSLLFERLCAHINESSVEIEEAASAARISAMARDHARAEHELRVASLNKDIARWTGLPSAFMVSSVSTTSFDRSSRRDALASSSVGSNAGGGGNTGAGEDGIFGGSDAIFETLPYKYIGHLMHDRPLGYSGASSATLRGGRSPAMLTRQRSLTKREPHAVDLVARVECAKGQLPARSMTMHPSLPLLITADSRDCITTYDFSDANKPRQVSRFSNKNLTRSMINSLTWIGTGEASMVLVASDDGHVRVWRDPCSVSTRIVSAFSAFGDAAKQASPGERNPPLIVDWQPSCEHVHCAWAHNPGTVRIWDLNAEKCASEVQSPTGQIVGLCSSLSEMHSSLVVIGCGDGSLRVFDKRDSSGSSAVVAFSREHRDPVLSMRISNDFLLVTGTTTGEIKVWDVRRPVTPLLASLLSFSANKSSPEPIDALSIHSTAPVLACAPQKQAVVGIFSTEDSDLNQIRLQSQGFVGGFMGSTKPPRVQALAWHQDELAVAVATDDNVLSVYAARLRVNSVWVASNKPAGSVGGEEDGEE